VKERSLYCDLFFVQKVEEKEKLILLVIACLVYIYYFLFCKEVKTFFFVK